MEQKGERLCADVGKCLHCGACVGSCPSNSMYLNEVVLEFGEECTLCKRCTKVCPVGAIMPKGACDDG
ncbi:MAG: 4Fe-4S dicluster domain-containing protein [Methanobacteriota archaeon]|nr:MAG: 4Fe-4S dicluster domain-containing protein [Euryarchaeota archaeon]